MTGEIPLDLVGRLRGEIRAAARTLAEAGLPADVVLAEARAGIGDAVAARSRSGR